MSKQIVCNMCGKVIDYYSTDSSATIHGKMEDDSVFAGEFIHMDLCAKCLDKIISDCTISPFIEIPEGMEFPDDDEDGNGDDSYQFFPYTNL